MSKDKQLGFAFRLFEGMLYDNLNYIYRGNFTQPITDDILLLTEANMKSSGESSKVKKRVYSIMVEGLQNITRHQDEEAVEINERSGIFIIQKSGNEYFITTGNIVENNKIDHLKALLNKINSLEQDQLKDYYKEVLTAGEFSEKGGAGLGLIEMARKSGNKLTFDFKNIDDKTSYFYLHSGISFTGDEIAQIDSETHQKSLDNIVSLHTILNEENILISFNGIFNQESLVLLLSIIEGQMAGEVVMKKKIFYLMVEMLQNIVKHAAKREINTESGNPGMFLIRKKSDNYYLISGNYIETSKVEELKKKIEHVNNLSQDELDEYYSKNLLDFEKDDSKKSGLGIIDLRIKSENELSYNLKKLDDNTSFFALQVTVN